MTETPRLHILAFPNLPTPCSLAGWHSNNTGVLADWAVQESCFAIALHQGLSQPNSMDL